MANNFETCEVEVIPTNEEYFINFKTMDLNLK
jgi:hypothetical protein